MTTLRAILAFIAIGCVATSSFGEQPYAPVTGQPHADFLLPSIDDGKPIALSDFRGKKVLLIQFASW